MIKLVKKKVDNFYSFEYFNIYIDDKKLEKTQVSKSIDNHYYDYISHSSKESKELADIEISEFEPFGHISLDNLFDWTDINNNLFLMLDSEDVKSISLEITIEPNMTNWNKSFSFAEFCNTFEEFWDNPEKTTGRIEYSLDYDNTSLGMSDIVLYDQKTINHLTSKNVNSFKEVYEKTVRKLLVKNDKKVEYDFFISHASEDKESFVRPFAEVLINEGYMVWYDEFELKIGDKLRRSIDRGLANSRFGIVVISPHFFRKNWTQYELDGLIQREMTGEKAILPLWHKVSKDEVMKFSPSLADTVALNTAMFTIDELVAKLSEVFK